MNNNKDSIFNPRNPLFLDIAKWVVLVSSGIMILFAFAAFMNNMGGQGFLFLLGSVFIFFTGMTFVNMLHNIYDIKEQTKETNVLLKKQIDLQQKNEIE
ncbi:hypothetical protein BK011_04365 [Tenericutes bacterium MZ-XQ]|nr:hypothetical protein BK011_04365 [Tenericutes bacterium MZ-XQ]